MSLYTRKMEVRMVFSECSIWLSRIAGTGDSEMAPAVSDRSVWSLMSFFFWGSSMFEMSEIDV